MANTSVTAVAKRLGMKASEIVDVTDAPEGLLITTFDGQTLIEVPADRPDADGNTGLMFFRRPPASGVIGFGVYAATPTADDADDAEPATPEGLTEALEVIAERDARIADLEAQLAASVEQKEAAKPKAAAKKAAGRAK
jgi:hypothetical protein